MFFLYMSQVTGQLDLSGINIQKFTSKRQARPGVKPKFQINPGPTVVTESPNPCSSKLISFVFLSILVIAALVSFFQNTSNTSNSVSYLSAQPMKQLTGKLRKIIRMQCTHDSNSHCVSKNEGGEYVVNIKSCTVYDFNGIPFTDVLRDSNKNWHVPPANDMTLIVNKACKEITATYDTDTKYYTAYAHKNAKGTYIKKIVWIPAKSCYTDFNLKIGNNHVLEGTPATMITQEELNGVVAYIYKVKGKIQGSISVTGSGCNVPIHVYSEKT